MNLRDQLRRKFALQNIDNNTFIGGVAALIPDAATMATVLDIPVSDIKNYKVNGKDVSFTVLNDYTLTAGAFSRASGARGDAITYYFDFGGRVVNTSGTVFSQFQRANPSKILFYFPKLTFLENGSFNRLEDAIIAMKIVTPIGRTALDNDVFASTNNLTLYTNNANATNNGGNPDGDIVELLANNGNVTYITDTTNPDRITNITLVNIGATFADITFDLATHVNNYLYVIAVVNGVSLYLNPTTLSTVVNLFENSKNSFQLLAVDEYFNVSPLSRKRTFFTSSINPSNLFANASAFYKMQDTTGQGLDASINDLDGTVSLGVTRTGGVYRLDAAGDKFTVPNNILFNFRESGANTDFVIGIKVKFNSFNPTGRNHLITKRNQNNVSFNEFQLNYRTDLNALQAIIWADDNSFSLVQGGLINLNEDAWVVFTHISGVIYLYLNGVLADQTDLPVNFNFNTTASDVVFGTSLLSESANQSFADISDGFIIKGRGFTNGDASDQYNNGNGVEYPNLISLQSSDFNFNLYNVPENNYFKRSAFATTRIETDATQIKVSYYSPIVDSGIQYQIDGSVSIFDDTRAFVDSIAPIDTPNLQTATITLPGTGTRQFYLIESGNRRLTPTSFIGTYIQEIEAVNGTLKKINIPDATNRIVVIGDSISVGDGSSLNSRLSWQILLRDALNSGDWSTTSDGWAAAYTLGMYATNTLQQDGANRVIGNLAGATGRKVVIWALGTNDFGFVEGNPTDVANAAASVWDKINAQDSSVEIICITPTYRDNQNTPNSLGFILQDYRDALTTAANARYFVDVYNGEPIVSIGNFTDGLHPNDAGHQQLATYIQSIL